MTWAVNTQHDIQVMLELHPRNLYNFMNRHLLNSINLKKIKKRKKSSVEPVLVSEHLRGGRSLIHRGIRPVTAQVVSSVLSC